MAVSGIGFLCSILTAHIFWTALQSPVRSNYNLAVILNLFLLSTVFAGLFLFALVVRAYQWMHSHPGLAPTKLISKRRKFSGSEFARRWSNRRAATYEDIRRYRRESGDQVALRLKCSSGRSQEPAPWPKDLRSDYRRQRQK